MAKIPFILAVVLSAAFFAWCFFGIVRSSRRRPWTAWLMLRLPWRRRRVYNKSK